MTAPIDPAGREAELRELAAENDRLRRTARDAVDAAMLTHEQHEKGIVDPVDVIAAIARECLDNRAKADRLQRQVDAVRAEALHEAADEVHREARWQQEMILRGQGQHIQSVGRLLVVESILLNRAAALDAVQSETETGE